VSIYPAGLCANITCNKSVDQLQSAAIEIYSAFPAALITFDDAVADDRRAFIYSNATGTGRAAAPVVFDYAVADEQPPIGNDNAPGNAGGDVVLDDAVDDGRKSPLNDDACGAVGDRKSVEHGCGGFLILKFKAYSAAPKIDNAVGRTSRRAQRYSFAFKIQAAEACIEYIYAIRDYDRAPWDGTIDGSLNLGSLQNRIGCGYFRETKCRKDNKKSNFNNVLHIQNSLPKLYSRHYVL
jgi:hypothetical protein